MESRSIKTIISLAIATAFTGVLISLARPAQATFPGKNGRISFLEVNASNTAVDIYTINPDGSDEHQLTSLGPSQFVANSAQWSRNGRQLVFPVVTANPVPGPICGLSADGRNQHAVFTDPGNLDLHTTFSPDGNHIVCTRCQAGGQPPCAIYR